MANFTVMQSDLIFNYYGLALQFDNKQKDLRNREAGFEPIEGDEAKQAKELLSIACGCDQNDVVAEFERRL